MKNKKLSILILFFILAVLPIALILTKQRQEIRKKAATNDINVYLNANTVSPNGTTSGGVIVTVGTPVVDTATVHITYDSSKITLSNLRCGDGLDRQFIDVATPGNYVIRCFKQGLPAGPKAFALFDVAAGATTGDYAISLGQNMQLVSNNTVVTGNKVPATLHVTTTAVPVSFSFGASSGTVKLIPGSTPITTAQLVFTYDASKITVSGLACDTNNFPQQSRLSMTSGRAEIYCSSQTGVSGTTSKNIASFNIAVSSGATGSVAINFDASIGNSKLIKADSTEVPAQFTNGTFQITQAGPYFTPTCAVKSSTQITAYGSGFGASKGTVTLLTLVGGPANIAIGDIDDNWTDTMVKFKVSSGFPLGQYTVRVNSVQLSGTLTVADSCVVVTPPPTTAPTATPRVTPTPTPGVTAPPTATPRITPTPTPTATVDPNRPASLMLSPASATVGTSPVLIEIKLNSGAKKVTTAQAIVLVDSKLSLVDASGNAVTEIIPGNTALSSLRVNRYASNVITYASSKASETAVASTINGVFAKFYVKTTQTTGTATISFRTGSTPEDSAILDENAVYILGRAEAVTLNLGSGCGQGNSIVAGTLTTDPQGRYHVPLTLCASPAPALTFPVGGETANYLLKVIGASDTATAADLKSYLADPNNCSQDLPTGGKVYCSTSFTSSVDYIFNPGATGARKLWAIYHNDAAYSAASYWGIANSSWSNPVSTGVVNIPVSGNNFTFKLKFVNINAKPTTPNVTGLDYEHEKARVIIKSGDNELLKKDDVVLTAGDNGIYTSAPVNLGSLASGTYKLYVKPVGYFQKRFKDIAFPPGGMLDLTTGDYKFEAGDSNNDGVINLVDVNIVISAIQKQAAGTLTASDYNQSDYDRNGIINSGDTAAIFETMKIRYDDE